MGLPNTFGTGTAWQAAWLDQNFAAVGACTTIPCTATGTNTQLLTPAGNTPVPAYAPYQLVGFIATGGNSGAATANVNSLGPLPIYKDTAAGPVALTGSEIVAGNYTVLAYDPALNAGGGGFHLQTAPSVNAGSVTSVIAGTGLAGGTITSTGTISFSPVANLALLANVSGGSAVPSANTMSAILDAVFGSTQGSVLYRGASLWARLGPGTVGQTLNSGGAAANPGWQGGVATGISAAGTTQGTATLLAAAYNQVTTVGASSGVLMAPVLGVPQVVFNAGANTLTVYPPSGGQIDGLGTNTGATIASINKAGYVLVSATQAYTLP